MPVAALLWRSLAFGLACWVMVGPKVCLGEAAERRSNTHQRYGSLVSLLEAEEETLPGAGDYPWYDEENDRLRRIDVAPSPPPEIPDEWTSEVKPKDEKIEKGVPTAANPLLTYLIWGLLPAVFIGLVVFAIVAWQKAPSSDDGNSKKDQPKRSEADRVDNLPVQLKRPQADLLEMAREYYAQRNYNEAIIYYYSHLLLVLDRNHLIRLTKGKTNRQYLAEINGHESLIPPLHETMLAFEDVFFGDVTLLQDRFEQCWNQQDEFQQQAERLSGA